MLGLHDEKFMNIISSVRAILFLATPHRGSDLAGMLNRILAACVLTHNPKTYVSELKHGSQTIATLNDQFRHVASDLDIISFYETAPTGWGPKKVVCILSPTHLCRSFALRYLSTKTQRRLDMRTKSQRH